MADRGLFEAQSLVKLELLCETNLMRYLLARAMVTWSVHPPRLVSLVWICSFSPGRNSKSRRSSDGSPEETSATIKSIRWPSFRFSRDSMLFKLEQLEEVHMTVLLCINRANEGTGRIYSHAPAAVCRLRLQCDPGLSPPASRPSRPAVAPAAPRVPSINAGARVAKAPRPTTAGPPFCSVTHSKA
ncbi:hypothetical protein EJB05_29695, partial [Eragrostis curvula]